MRWALRRREGSRPRRPWYSKWANSRLWSRRARRVLCSNLKIWNKKPVKTNSNNSRPQKCSNRSWHASTSSKTDSSTDSWWTIGNWAGDLPAENILLASTANDFIIIGYVRLPKKHFQEKALSQQLRKHHQNHHERTGTGLPPSGNRTGRPWRTAHVLQEIFIAFYEPTQWFLQASDGPQDQLHQRETTFLKPSLISSGRIGNR